MTSSAHQISRQRHAVTVLGRLLERASTGGLPVISWTVGTAGASVTGRCDRPSGAAERRADYGTWRAELTAWAGSPPDTDRESPAGSGAVYLAAQWGWAAEARVVLAADIYPDEDAG